MRTLKEKLIHTVYEEIDVYTNLVAEEVVTKEVRDFIQKTIIPRFNKLRAIVNGYKDEEDMFPKT